MADLYILPFCDASPRNAVIEAGHYITQTFGTYLLHLIISHQKLCILGGTDENLMSERREKWESGSGLT
jgi:hypothetical protein